MVDQATSRQLQVIVVTPERAVLDERADSIVLTMYDGELGILPGRAAFVGRLGFGELRMQRGNETLRYYVDGGFGQCRANVVTILTPRALRATDIDVVAAQAVLDATGSADGEAARRRDQERARAQLRVAGQVTGAGHH